MTLNSSEVSLPPPPGTQGVPGGGVERPSGCSFGLPSFYHGRLLSSPLICGARNVHSSATISASLDTVARINIQFRCIHPAESIAADGFIHAFLPCVPYAGAGGRAGRHRAPRGGIAMPHKLVAGIHPTPMWISTLKGCQATPVSDCVKLRA